MVASGAAKTWVNFDLQTRWEHRHHLDDVSPSVRYLMLRKASHGSRREICLFVRSLPCLILNMSHSMEDINFDLVEAGGMAAVAFRGLFGNCFVKSVFKSSFIFLN